ncbi:dTDP-4-dehydrorhamnose 3,5-epimerase [Leucothrix arctica]|uniref:dTDP-4-dehydrorhamnose 3,5-epimerase n=1 Tax=Leucothrix arctica TaxID=1481894 RepID=A0A317CCE1_9GAMM|nr:dTDP-4-dehydrorhamnose 3,5-epimerase [Leucothrix arctica]PWQ95013.1 dTDP-4-dehydrorhamnose 3,5-epimerase [Leucothrix arctica]
MQYTFSTIPDVKLLEPAVFGDHRGFFMETWQQRDFNEQVGKYSFVQDNHSKSAHGILRGLHYQIKQPQGKLVRVVQGSVFDVAVDMRKSSPTFGKWVGYELSEENKHMLWVPPGFAHGFYVMSETAEFVYKCTDYYAPEYERSLLWNDPSIGIEWPLINREQPTLSDKDAKGDSFDLADKFD